MFSFRWKWHRLNLEKEREKYKLRHARKETLRGCLIMDNDAHPHDYLLRRGAYEKEVGEEEYYRHIPTAPIVIGDDVWIGARCQILKGVHIGARSIIAAGSVVTKDIPSDCIAGGNPAKVLRYL